MSTDFQPDWTMPLSEYARVQKENMPKIKPLVWVQTGLDWRAATPIGAYEVWKVMGNNRWRWMQQGFPGSYCDSEALAKAACEQEYERRVRECLE